MYVLPYGQMSLWGMKKNYYSTGKNYNKPDKKFMSLFMGLVDGDGYIEIGPQKQYNNSTESNPKSTIRARLVIRLHERDASLLTYLKDVLGVGSISNLKPATDRAGGQTRLIFSKKDLVTVIIPLIKEYNMQFLTANRAKQFSLLNHIIDNNIVHWENVDFYPINCQYSVESLLNLDFFALAPNPYPTDQDRRVVGFTVAEGSFGVKSRGDAFFQIKQKGIENYNIIKAISLLIVNREPNIKADYTDSYQLTFTSKADIQQVVNFFSKSNDLYGYKLIQYKEWVDYLKTSDRYKGTIIPS